METRILVDPDSLFEIWDQYSKVVVCVHQNVCSPYFVPIDKNQFRAQIKNDGKRFYFKTQPDGDVLYIEGIGIDNHTKK